MSNNEMVNKVRELKELMVMAEDIAAEIAALQDEIKADMAVKGVDEITVDVFKIRWQTVTTKRFDKKSMIQMFGEDCYNGFCKPVTSRRFTVV